MSDHCVIDGSRHVIRCNICGDEIPMPLGAVRWVAAVIVGFTAEHSSEPHEGRRTWFKVPPSDVVRALSACHDHIPVHPTEKTHA
jgi:hypothetical protein